MTVATAPALARRRRRPGWRGPEFDGDFPSLGWGVLEWTYAYLPSPADEKQPLVYTDEQARRIVRWFEVDPDTGDLPYRELVLEDAKGWGKSPLAGSLMLAALRGPVCFDGWDANGDPVGVPWGTGLRPPPWIQIAAVSEDQPLALDTPVPTPSGWTIVGDLLPGDRVIAADGRPAVVARETPVLTGLDCYAVTFSDGERIVASASHSWTMERRTLHGDRRENVTVSTEQMSVDHRDARGGARYRVAAIPFELPDVPLAVDPYLLGLWLGDGATGDSTIAIDTRDRGELDALIKPLLEPRERVVWNEYEGNVGTLRIRNETRTEATPSFRERLRSIGVLGAKQIPSVYLRAGASQRQALLQGLIDSDGHVTAKGRVSFTNINARLIACVGELLTSLGYVWSSRFDGHAHRLFFSPSDSRPIARLARKHKAQRLGGRRSTSVWRYVVSVDQVESVPVRCIGIDTRDRLFLAGRRAVPTHNTDNTYGALYAMVVANNHKAAIDLRIDDGRTRLYLPDMPGAVLEPVTAAHGSREGQRLTDAVLDETWLWKPTNGGIKLARTIRRNLAKMSGRSVETTNSPILGERSVAEQNNPAVPTPGVLHFANRPSDEPQPDWSDEQLRAALRETYRDASWVDPERLIREMRDPKNPWDESLRFWFNLRQAGAGRAVDPRLWDARKDPRARPPAGTRVGAGFDGSISQDATVIRAETEDGYSFLWEAWEKPTGPELQRWLDAHPDKDAWEVDRLEVDQSIAELFATMDVGLMLCDTPKWRTEIEGWADRYATVDADGKRIERVIAFDTNSERRFAPAVDRWTTALREGTHTHDDDPLTNRHVKAAHRRKTRATGDDTDGRTMYVLVKGDDHGRIDAAVTDVLAHEAAMILPSPAEAKPTPSIY